jgi:hypothetical protein
MASSGPAPSDQWRYLTLEALERDVRTMVLPDNDDTQDEHPWEWLAELLRVHGIEATAEELRLLPYDVVFSERLRARVMADAQGNFLAPSASGGSFRRPHVAPPRARQSPRAQRVRFGRPGCVYAQAARCRRIERGAAP